MFKEKINLIPGKLYTVKSDNKRNWYFVDGTLLSLLAAPTHINYKLCNNIVFIKQVPSKSVEGYYECYFLFENKLIKRMMSDKNLFLRCWK